MAKKQNASGKIAGLKKTFLWWRFLCITAIINIAIWLWALSVHIEAQNFSSLQLILSGCYVLVCAFRSFLPRIDLERYCLFDTPLSSILLGRSLATFAEICFSIQLAILIYDLGVSIEVPLVTTLALCLVPIIIIAQIACWYAALTLNHFWHGIEEALWVLMILLAAVCLVCGIVILSGPLQLILGIGLLACAGAAWVMLFIDIPMYFSRNRKHRNKQPFLNVAEGIRDAGTRRVQTSQWKVWKHEVLWISTYFTFGVWLSIGMIFVRF